MVYMCSLTILTADNVIYFIHSVYIHCMWLSLYINDVLYVAELLSQVFLSYYLACQKKGN
jgi:hypothetical protein